MKNAACVLVCAVKHKPSQLSPSAAVHLYSARNRRLVAVVALVSLEIETRMVSILYFLRHARKLNILQCLWWNIQIGCVCL